MSDFKINYSRFKKILGLILVFDSKRFDDSEEFEDFYQDAYIEYKTWIKQLYNETVQEWAEVFYQEINIEEHGFMLKSKYDEYIKPLKDIASKSTLK